jgi:hypothetical protein
MGDTNISLVHVAGDTTEAVSKPIMKLMANVARFVEPYHVRRLAQAKGEAAIIEAKAEVEVARIKDEGVIELLERALGRFASVEMNRQVNIEATVESAKRYLPPTVSEAPVDPAWMATFFDCAKDVSEERLRDLWGRLLAAEVATPGVCSKRTLRTLQDLSPREAAIFVQACCMSLRAGDTMFLPLFGSNPMGIDFSDCLILDNCGLLHGTGSLTFIVNEPTELTFASGQQIRISPRTKGATIPCFGLPPTASELSRVVTAATPEGYVEAVLILLRGGPFDDVVRI